MSGIMNQLEDEWDAWLHTEENKVAADLSAARADGGSEQDDSSAAQLAAHHHHHHEADPSVSHHEAGSADHAADIDNMGYTTTEEMMTDNMTAEDIPTFY